MKTAITKTIRTKAPDKQTRTSLQLPESLFRQALARARAEDISLSALTRRALRRELQTH